MLSIRAWRSWVMMLLASAAAASVAAFGDPPKPPTSPTSPTTPPVSPTAPTPQTSPTGGGGAPTVPVTVPVGPRPLIRKLPLLYDVKLEYVVSGFPRGDGPAITMRDFAFVLPIAISGPTSRIDPNSMQPELWFDSRQDKTITQRARIDPSKHLGMSWAILPLERFDGTAVRWNVRFRGQSWSVAVKEGLMAQIAWPREWPAEVADAQKPQLGIESDAPIVAALVKQALGEQARAMPPYWAAKELIRTTLLTYRSVNTDALEYRGLGRAVGMRVTGARQTLANRQGTTHDVVCACVAALRAAGIPARPVIGVIERSSRDARLLHQEKVALISWGEFWLPDAGWVPFDPELLRGNAVRQMKLGDAWPGVGTLPELNERMPVSWSFSPEGLAVPAFPALWSMQGSMGVDSNSLETYVSFSIIPRGKGIEDP